MNERICKKWYERAPAFGCQCWECQSARDDIEEARRPDREAMTREFFGDLAEASDCGTGSSDNG